MLNTKVGKLTYKFDRFVGLFLMALCGSVSVYIEPCPTESENIYDRREKS